MAAVRRFVPGLVRANKTKGSVKKEENLPHGTRASSLRSCNSNER
jgi:hypothetical protein